jgi:hypothetical protein
MNGMNRPNQSLVALIVALGVTGLSACGTKFGKSNDHKSKVETLDNLARGDDKVNPNECSVGKLAADKRVVIKEENIQIKGITSATQTQKLRDHVYQVIGNVPQSVLTVFFALDGVVEVNKNASAICRELQNSGVEADASQYSEGDHLVSCWKRNDKGAATIYVDPNVLVSDGDEGHLGIDHGLIRSFGYVVAEMFLKLDIAIDADDEKKWHVKELAEPKANDQLMLENLSEAFIKDVAASGGKYNLDDYQDLIDGTEAQKQKFRFFVFAEAFDSYHCNAETMSLISTDFPQTYKAMDAVVRSLSEEVTATSDAGLNLTYASGNNACNCFGGIGSILHGIFDGLRNIVIGTVQIIKKVVVGVFKIIMIPFKAVFGLIVCVYEPLAPGDYIGTTPIPGGVEYKTPLQHPCQQSVTQKSCLGGPNQNSGGVSVDQKTPIVDEKDKKDTSTTTVSSETKTDGDTAAPIPQTSQSAAKKKKKKWYQCGTLGGDEMTGFAPVGIMFLMTLPLFAVLAKREEE